MEDFRVCLNFGNLSQGGDCWKVSQLYFESIWKVIDCFPIKEILESGFHIIIGNILL